MILSGSETGIVDVAVNGAFRAHLAFEESSPGRMDEAFAAIRAEPGYRPTPLVALPALAARLGLGDVLCKDESRRFGAGGVKALGAPHGLRVLLRQRGGVGSFVAVAATDGNHGLALAWAARRQGGLARIFVGRDVDEVRLGRIRAEGAGGGADGVMAGVACTAATVSGSGHTRPSNSPHSPAPAIHRHPCVC